MNQLISKTRLIASFLMLCAQLTLCQPSTAHAQTPGTVVTLTYIYANGQPDVVKRYRFADEDTAEWFIKLARLLDQINKDYGLLISQDLEW